MNKTNFYLEYDAQEETFDVYLFVIKNSWKGISFFGLILSLVLTIYILYIIKKSIKPLKIINPFDNEIILIAKNVDVPF